MRKWIQIVEAFGTTDVLYHGCMLDHAYGVFKSGHLDSYGDDGGPSGVSLTRSLHVAHEHAVSDEPQMSDSFWEWFGITDHEVDFHGAVFEVPRAKLEHNLIPYDDMGDDAEEEERYLGHVSADWVTALYCRVDEIDKFQQALELAMNGPNGDDARQCYGEHYREIIARMKSVAKPYPTAGADKLIDKQALGAALDDIMKRAGQAGVSLSLSRSAYHAQPFIQLNHIARKTAPPGTGAVWMLALLRAADQFQVPIELYAYAADPKLQDYYRRFGFEVNVKKGDDAWMIRNPK